MNGLHPHERWGFCHFVTKEAGDEKPRFLTKTDGFRRELAVLSGTDQ